MKNFFKKISFVLALTMVLTNIGSVVATSASEVPSLRYSSKVLYVGGDATGKYTDNCWTPSQNTSGYKVSYEVIEGFSLVTVEKNGQIFATGNGVGKAVVAVTYSKVGENDITAKFTVKVRRNAGDVRLTNATQAKLETALLVGDKITLQAAKSLTKSYATGSYGLDNYRGVVTDQIEIVSSNSEVVKVDGLKLTAVSTGTATIHVVAKQYLTGEATGVKSADYTVVVIGGIVDVKQITTTTLQVTMAQAKKNLTADDFKVTQTTTTADNGIKEITVSSDKKVVTIETYFEMNDGAEYKITYDKKDYFFTATDGIVASTSINKSQIPYNSATAIYVNLLDANGIIIGTVKESTASEYDVDWEMETTSGAMYNDKLVLYAKGDTAKLTVTYRTNVYDSNGDETGVIGPQTYTITAMDIALDSNILATITDDEDDVCVYEWSGIASKGENRTFYAEDNRIINVYITDSEGNDITQDLFTDHSYYLESSNENILTVGSLNYHDHTEWSNGGKYIDDVGIWADIYGVKAGTANIIIKNSDGKVMFIIAITVGAARTFKSFDLGSSSATLTNSEFVTDDTVSISLILRDQYGNQYIMKNTAELESYVTATLVSDPSSGNNTMIQSYYRTTETNYGLKFNASKSVAGTYRWKIEITMDDTTVTKYITVIAKEANNSGSDTYKLVISGKTNSSCTDINTKKYTEIRIAHYKGGVLYEYLDYATSGINYIKELTVTYGKYAVTVTGNAVVTSTGDKGNGAAEENPGFTETIGSAISGMYKYPISLNNRTVVSGGSMKAVAKALTGTRSVQVTIINAKGNEVILKGSFTITDTQESMTAEADSTTITVSNKATGTLEDVIKEALTFRQSGNKEINKGAEENIIKVDTIKVNSSTSYKGSLSVKDYVDLGSSKIYVTSVIIYFGRNNKTDGVAYTVPVYKTITIK